MVRLIRSNADTARYWHRVDELGCSNSRLVQPDREPQETDVDPDHIGDFFEYSDKDPCPNCHWDPA